MGILTYWYCAVCEIEFSIDQEPESSEREIRGEYKEPKRCPFCGSKDLEDRN